jgi:hypothetical protein
VGGSQEAGNAVSHSVPVSAQFRSRHRPSPASRPTSTRPFSRLRPISNIYALPRSRSSVRTPPNPRRKRPPRASARGKPRQSMKLPPRSRLPASRRQRRPFSAVSRRRPVSFSQPSNPPFKPPSLQTLAYPIPLSCVHSWPRISASRRLARTSSCP